MSEQVAAPDVVAQAEAATNEKSSVVSSPGSHDLVPADDPHAGLEFPTDEERATLRRVKDAIPWDAYLIALIELAERFSFYGCQVVFTNFVQQDLPSRTGANRTGTPGALGRGQRASTGLTTFYQFWCYVTPLLGAYIADAHLGRFRTICIALAIALVGHILLIIAAVPGVIEKKGAIGAFIAALLVMGLGTGLFKANISPLVAEQYKKTKLFVRTTKSGERVIVDPALTIASIYMYFYFFINFGALVGQITMTYAEKYIGFWLAFTLPTVVFLLCPLVLWARRNHYVRTPPTGSVLATSLRLWRYAARGKLHLNPVRTWRELKAPGFWDNVKPSRHTAESKPKWMNFDDQWVDEVQRGYNACSVFLWFPIYWLTYNQLNNNLISQAATMVTNGIPNDVLSNLDPFALLIFIPLCDIVIYPALRRVGIRFSPLKRVTAGFMTGSMAMIWAAVVQHYIYKTSPCHNEAATCEDDGGKEIPAPLSVWIQSGAYILIALSEIFASITGLEYAFTKAPHNMRSLVMSVFLFASAVASALGEAFVALSEDPLLVWNYGTMAVIAGITGAIFWLSFRKLDSKEEVLNNMAEGHVADIHHHTRKEKS